jgi:hypothetical protein
MHVCIQKVCEKIPAVGARGLLPAAHWTSAYTHTKQIPPGKSNASTQACFSCWFSNNWRWHGLGLGHDSVLSQGISRSQVLSSACDCDHDRDRDHASDSDSDGDHVLAGASLHGHSSKQLSVNSAHFNFLVNNASSITLQHQVKIKLILGSLCLSPISLRWHSVLTHQYQFESLYFGAILCICDDVMMHSVSWPIGFDLAAFSTRESWLYNA